jgi:CubicO group peptidase (beta-lactamase class C family)
MIKSIIIVAIVVAVATTAQAQPLPTGAPESAGMSSERLLRIDAFFANEMERNRVPGAVVAIARQGKLVYFKAFGFADKPKAYPPRQRRCFSSRR